MFLPRQKSSGLFNVLSSDTFKKYVVSRNLCNHYNCCIFNLDSFRDSYQRLFNPNIINSKYGTR